MGVLTALPFDFIVWRGSENCDPPVLHCLPVAPTAGLKIEESMGIGGWLFGWLVAVGAVGTSVRVEEKKCR